jgi:surface polysaccharide O-acyltransferase-like enzyme
MTYGPAIYTFDRIISITKEADTVNCLSSSRVTDMAKLCAVLFMCVLLGAVVCAPLPENESSPSLGEVSGDICAFYVTHRMLYMLLHRYNASRNMKETVMLLCLTPRHDVLYEVSR